MNDRARCRDELCCVVVAVVCFYCISRGDLSLVPAATVGLCEDVCGRSVGGGDCDWCVDVAVAVHYHVTNLVGRLVVLSVAPIDVWCCCGCCLPP